MVHRSGIAGIIVGLVLSCLVLEPGPLAAQRMGGGGMGGGGGTGSSVIDPPVSGVFADPKEAGNVSTVPGTVEVNLEARIAPIKVNGTTANLMTYNGSYPGPTIRVKKGEMLKVNFTNSLPVTTATNLLGYRKNRTNLHTHGFHVAPEPPADFVMYDLEPGETYPHAYDTSMVPPGGLNFYHTHMHGLSAEQYWAGLVGALVVADPDDGLAGYETHILVLKDISLNGSSPAPHSMMSDYMHGKEGSTVMVNGQVNPRLYAEAGEVQRWRILNASNGRFYWLALDGHTFRVIGADGSLLDQPYVASRLLLSPGERVDVLVKAGAAGGDYKLKALPYSRMGMMTSPTITLLTVTYKGSRPQSLPAVIDASAQRLAVDTMGLTHRTLALSMGQGNGYINGQDFDVNPYMIMSTVGTYEVWTVVNNSGMDHPFHQHVNAAQVLSITGGDPEYVNLWTTTPARKDTVLVPKWGSVTLLVPIMDFGGMAMFHCHILEHEDIGMMGMWHLMSPMDGMPPMDGGTGGGM